MQINAVCPVCKTKYQLPEEMRGKMMRCPNSLCRHIFTVGAEPSPAAAPPQPPPAPKPNRPSAKIVSGSVGDFVQILPAEQVQTQAGPLKRAAPPVVTDVPELEPLVEAVPITSDVPELVEVVQPEVLEEVRPLVEESPTIPKPNGEATKKKPTPPPPQWETTPPVRRRPQAEPAPASPVRTEVPEPKPEAPAAPPLEAPGPLGGPQEIGPSDWETLAPPVRRGEGSEPAPEPELPPVPYYAPPAKKRRGLPTFIGAAAGLLVLAALGAFTYRSLFKQTEDGLYRQTTEEYEKGNFPLAASYFRQLQEKFPGSSRADEYAFMEKLSDLRAKLGIAKPEDGIQAIEAFVGDYKDNEFFRPHGRDLASSSAPVMSTFAGGVPIGETTPQDLTRVSKLREDLVDRLDDDTFTKAELASLDSSITDSRSRFELWADKQAVLAQLDKLPGESQPWAEAIQTANRLLRLHKLDQDGEARAKMERLYVGHHNSVTFLRADQPLTPAQPSPEEATIVSVPPVKRATADNEDGIVLTLARGVLYAHRRSDGQLKWFKRVGIDTDTLPVRVEAQAPNPATILVISADTQTLTALNDEGKQLWEYHLGKPSRGRPLIVENEAGRLVYVPTYDGQIHVIDLGQGKLVGRYDLHHRLTTGGVQHPPRKGLLYFPADDDCVYVIDPDPQKADDAHLVQILYTNHPAGSLRGEPLIIAPDSVTFDRGEGCLVLNQTQGLDAMRLRLFPLPLTDRSGPEAQLNPPARVPGWTWFQPTYDGEKVALLSDTGVLGLFGVQQTGDRDALLFPRMGPAGLSLDPFLPAATKSQGRAQVVQVQGDDYWVLAHGKLQHLQMAWSAARGPVLVPVWHDPLPLGSPLHSSQVFSQQNGRRTLLLVTQALTDPSCLATAVDSETRDILWQRQLGLVCRGTPLPLRLAADQEPVLLVQDQSGGLFAFDPAQTKFSPGERGVRVADAVEDNPAVQPLLLAGADGKSAYQVACPGDGAKLLCRHVELAEGRQMRVVSDQRIAINAPMHGTPAIVGNMLVVPLADGGLTALPLPLNSGPAELGAETWRVDGAPPTARGRIVALAPNRFIVNNGAQGFQVWEKKTTKGMARWVVTPDALAAPGPEVLKNNVVSGPALLSLDAAANTAEVCVADALGVVWVLGVQANGQVKQIAHWDLKRKITAGPFVRTVDNKARIGCVVDQRQLVWLDPKANKPLWTYDTADKPILGEPQLVDGLLMVTDQAGNIVGLDPATGKAETMGYSLQGSLAPVATPVGFGAAQLFVPLSDGTTTLLPMTYFRKPKAAPPAEEK